MKYSAVVAAVVGVAAAQNLGDIPQCALKCLTPAIQSTGCAQTDIACLCKPSNFQSVVSAGTGCVIQSCGQDVAVNQVLPAVNKLCASAGGSSASGSASGSAPASSSAPASQSSVSSSSAPAQTSGSVSTTKSPSSTLAPTASSGGSSSSSSRAATTSAPQPSAPANGTQTTRPSTAAAAAATGLGSFAMLALGALAAF